MTARPGREFLGELLVRRGFVSREGLDKALERQKSQGGRLGLNLAQLGLVGDEDLSKALGEQLGVLPFLPSMDEIEKPAIERLSKQLAKKYEAIPVSYEEKRGLIRLATSDPTNLEALDEIRFATRAKRAQFMVAPQHLVQKLIAFHYDGIAPEPEKADVELSSNLFTLSGPAGSGATETARKARTRGRVILADPDRKRKRALASLLEAAGFDVLRPDSPEEALTAFRDFPTARLWVQTDWADSVRSPGRVLYADPVASIETQAGYGARTGEEAARLASEAIAASGRGDPGVAGEAISLLRFLGGRSGLCEGALKLLELRAWRTALNSWQLPSSADGELEGADLLAVVAAYFGHFSRGGTRSEAAEIVRSDKSLNGEAAAMLLRWAVGAELLNRMGDGRKLLALGLSDETAGAMLARLSQSGWSVERIDTWREGSYDAVLAAMSPGLQLLENMGRGGPPVFIVTDSSNAPDQMYALRVGAEDVFDGATHPDVVDAKLERAALRIDRGKSGPLKGDLKEMGFADLIQVLSNRGRTVVVRMETAEASGQIALKDGLVVDARTAGLKGTEAFFYMVAWEEGTFQIDSDAEPPETTIQGESTEGLLMEGFRLYDERKRGGE